MIAQLPAFVGEAAVIAGTITAMLGTLVAFWKKAPIQWLWKKLVSDPAKKWWHNEILTTMDESLDSKLDIKFTPLMEQFRNNGGGSMKDALDRIEERQIIADARSGRTEAKVAELEQGLDIIRSDVDVLQRVVGRQ